MPKHKVHPSLARKSDDDDDNEEEITDADIMRGGPTHGSRFEPGPEEPDDDDYEDDELDEVEEDDDEDDYDKRLRALEAENARLRQSIPPPAPRTPEPEPEEEEPDWETLLYSDPKKALELHGERVRKQVTKELRTEYQQDRNREKFWNDFYKRHKDLVDDKDLVQVTLNANMSVLGGLPIEQSMDELADLTRQRIIRYRGEQPRKKSRKKAKAEGATEPTAPRPKPTQTNVTTLSDIIRSRREKRMKGTAA